MFCGWGCGPTPVRTPIPARADPVACPAGQVRTCLGRCATPAQLNQPCTLSATTIAECTVGFVPCAAGLACVAGPGSIAPRCVPPLPANGPPNQTQPGAPQACDPSLGRGQATFGPNATLRSNACVNTNVCMRTFPSGSLAGQCVRIDTNAGGVPVPTQRGCISPAIDGELCDSSWNQAIATAGVGAALTCRPCAPGLLCFNNRCERPCWGTPGTAPFGYTGLNTCVSDPTNLPTNNTPTAMCRPVYQATTPAEADAGQVAVFAIQATAPNSVCANCGLTRRQCSPIGFDAREENIGTVTVPALPPHPSTLILAPHPSELRPWSFGAATTALVAPSASTGAAVVAGSGLVVPSRVNVTNRAATGVALVANPLCCTATDQCVNGSCCVPPAPPAGPVPACTSDADCCPFAVTYRTEAGQPLPLGPPGDIRGVPRLTHKLCMSVSNASAGSDRTPHARDIWSAYANIQTTGCFARNCGGRGQPCCPPIAGLQQTRCNGGLACDGSDTTCQPRCAQCDRCPFGERCSSGFCRTIPAAECGRPNQPCCGPGVDPAAAPDGCNDFAAAGRSFCAPLVDTRCPARLQTCQGCGRLGQVCCPNMSCDTGYNYRPLDGTGGVGALTCQPPIGCGGLGQPCCVLDGQQVCNDAFSLTCSGGRCVACGGVGERCCGALHTPFSCRTTATGQGVSCNMPPSRTAPGPVCEVCGGTGQACCYAYSGDAIIGSCTSATNSCQRTDRVGRSTCQPGP